jgi:hypothetical protein
MRRGLRSVLSCIAVAMALATAPFSAAAQCDLSTAELLKRAETSRLGNMAKQWNRQHRPGLLFRDRVEFELTYVVRVGYILGQQARHVGSSAYRERMYACLFDRAPDILFEATSAALAIDDDLEPAQKASILHAVSAESGRLFRSAALGTLDAAQVARFKLDSPPDFGSIFKGVSGNWVFDLVGNVYVNGNPVDEEIHSSLQLDFQEREGRLEVEIWDKDKNLSGRVPVRIDGDLIGFDFHYIISGRSKLRYSMVLDSSVYPLALTVNARNTDPQIEGDLRMTGLGIEAAD